MGLGLESQEERERKRERVRERKRRGTVKRVNTFHLLSNNYLIRSSAAASVGPLMSAPNLFRTAVELQDKVMSWMACTSLQGQGD